MNLKEYLEKQVTEKRNQITNLEKALVESDDKEERAKLGETLTKLRDELNEAEKQLTNVEDQGQQEEQQQQERQNEEHKEAEQRSLEVRGTYFMNGGKGGNEMEQRQKKMNEELEKRGKELKERRSVLVSSGDLVLPKHTGTVLNDTFQPVSTLLDKVAVENLNGGESYEEAFVKSYGTGGITEEGSEYTTAEPVFEYAPMSKVKITAYAEISEETKKLPNVAYAEKVKDAVFTALKKKLSQQVIAGTGTKELVGITASPVAIDKAKDIEITDIDVDTLNTVIFSYGGDEAVESQVTLILNKKTLKALSEVRKANGDLAYNIDVSKKTINTIPYEINSNVPAFDTATNGQFIMLYGDTKAYKVPTFSPVEIMESTDYKFKEGMICVKGSVFVGGNVVKQDGFLRVKKKSS